MASPLHRLDIDVDDLYRVLKVHISLILHIFWMLEVRISFALLYFRILLFTMAHRQCIDDVHCTDTVQSGFCIGARNRCCIDAVQSDFCTGCTVGSLASMARWILAAMIGKRGLNQLGILGKSLFKNVYRIYVRLLWIARAFSIFLANVGSCRVPVQSCGCFVR